MCMQACLSVRPAKDIFRAQNAPTVCVILIKKKLVRIACFAVFKDQQSDESINKCSHLPAPHIVATQQLSTDQQLMRADCKQ